MTNRLIISALIVTLVVLVAYSLTNNINGPQDPRLDQVRERFALIDPKYASIPIREGNSSFTENKEIITLCLKDPSGKRYYDMNTIMYVALHELAHVVTKKGEEHGPEFRKNFMGLLKQGSELGFYDPSRTIPPTYCKS